VRGRLDISPTARLRGAGSAHVAFMSSARDLDNDVSRMLGAAERVLSHHIGREQWRTPRVNELLPPLHAAVGVRPRLPSKRALDRIRYSLIRRPFKTAAELSWRLAHSKPSSPQAKGKKRKDYCSTSPSSGSSTASTARATPSRS
jgi:hypothetical protein